MTLTDRGRTPPLVVNAIRRKMKGEKIMEYGKRVLLKEYKNGNKLWGTVTRCAKCAGTGKVIWTYADHVCFDCNGKGWYYDEEREYTPANLAKREAAQAAKRAKEDAERAELEAARVAEEAWREAERLAEIERNRGNFIGNAGDRIEADVTFASEFYYERPCYNAPWKTEGITGYVFKTDEGNTLVWKTTGTLGEWDKKDRNLWVSPEEGDRIKIKGTIKAHEEYNNVNQTILTRVKWVR